LLATFGARLLRLPLPWAMFAKIAVACALMAAAVSLIPGQYGLVSLIAKAATGALVYAIAAWAFDFGGLKARTSALYQILPRKKAVPSAQPFEMTAPPPPHGERIVYAGARDTTTPRLSILTPFFRHDPSPLIQRLALQKRPVELVLLDDGSGDAALLSNVVAAAEALAFPVRIIVWGQNGGRAAARNRLVAEARADYALFLDADMIPDADDFIDRWLGLIGAEHPAAAFGGLSLKQTIATPETKLHHVIFARSDCRSAEDRARDAAQFTAASNLLIRRDVLEQTPFDHGFSGWGWEDVDWALRASRLGAIRHIDNPATHAGLDSAETLLRKAREAGPNYARLIAKHPAPTARFNSRRIASALRLLPAQAKLQRMWSWLARDPFGATPMLVRRTALKLYRTSIYAEHLP
jgi:glycosyltransferase involved in cell wall biosynthesis